MEKFFKNHSDFMRIALSVVFFATLAFYFYWGMGVILGSLNGAANLGSAGQNALMFDLGGAANLNLKGLVQ